MNEGDRVTLLEQVGHHMPGAEGKIVAVTPDGRITVEMTYTANCEADPGLLPAQPKSRFSLGGHCGG